MDIYAFFNNNTSLLIFLFAIGSILAGFHMDHMYRNKRDTRLYQLFVARFINYAIAFGVTLAISPIASLLTALLAKKYMLSPETILSVEYWSGIFTWVILILSVVFVIFDFKQNLAQKIKFEKYIEEK